MEMKCRNGNPRPSSDLAGAQGSEAGLDHQRACSVCNQVPALGAANIGLFLLFHKSII